MKTLIRPLTVLLLCPLALQGCFVEKPIEGLTPVALQAKSGRQAPQDVDCSGVTIPSAASAARPEEADRLNAQGRELAQAQRLREARSFFEQAARLDPTSADAVFNLARTQESLGYEDDAYDSYCGYLALAPNAPDAFQVRVRLADLKEFPPSIPEEAASRFRVGIGYAQSGALEHARESYDRAVGTAPGWADAYYNRALVLEGLRDYDDARRDLERYLDLKPAAQDVSRVRDKIHALELQEAGGRKLSIWRTAVALTIPVVTTIIYQCTDGFNAPPECGPWDWRTTGNNRQMIPLFPAWNLRFP